MKHASFYLLAPNQQLSTITTQEELICSLVYKTWHYKNKRVLIACKNKKQAIQLDDMLWENLPYSFIPHNIANAGPKHGAPIELTWEDFCSNKKYDVVVNLLTKCSNYILSFCEIIDFVPLEESSKKLARERYKQYRNQGFKLNTIKLSQPQIKYH
ncbi:DNA polymerase III subunit chi [Candidatus Erwinia haradaeae]|uniref:DNA polymerase III subunit chi n=1 Tax=Candidatus Erwinia haradaeae TaxID=1922217 RepID=A0A451DP36_9GAMM|nr:DNA polymerase III subunit chi [Candidatus Erwinia haradaeae]VFP88555.1 DNA polymerase III subunit chi [Candidatus Erwinia haradaeae]